MKISILNLIPRFIDETTQQSVNRGLELAKWADGQKFERYWVAEHHNSKSISCSATDLIIGYILENTQKIKVGAGGVMLPNHTPFQVAERYGTLETLYPDRVDLGIGRAPGTDIETAKLIYRDTYKEDNFKEAIRTLLGYFEDEAENLKVRPYPGVGTHVPVYILGSSMTSAYIAAELGLPYSFAGHFSPNTVEAALKIYREEFKPSKYLDKPYVMLGVSANAAYEKDAAEQIKQQAISIFLQIQNRNNRDAFLKADPNNSPELTSIEKFMIRTARGLRIEGDVNSVKDQFMEIKQKYNPDEIIAASYIPDFKLLKENYEIVQDLVLNE